MADRLSFSKRSIRVGQLAQCALATLLLSTTLTATAQSLPALADPTRPPASVATDSGAAEADSGPALQSVMLPRQGKPAALISGQWVRLGEVWNGSRLVRVSEREVVLRGEGGTLRLLLTPEAVKTPTGETRKATQGMLKKGNQ
ncbi:MSHA biogenesis protein MshK [Rhodocyclus tenuis]|uniref:MSHA biogenesis protein MshK n=2 Tax=Rhodocyclus TaxID=1064 RepID=A0A6L5JTG5_RHOTE|nr:MSHA biogenesis protein MshK [Rhodocyclus gracilis]MQY50683.1 MSHA biogenesis protein MshK [Rhodocyclus gracilis]MRD72686.1 MSHA biogenesis protein MshK [Rhodocyclus gracilis]NJA88213.1 MSHA biogenesis protein MshK [Rhodocyclus gracilis]